MKAIRLLSKIIMLSLVSLMGFAQDRVITGLVTDGNSGSGIPGVSILFKNSARGVTSDASGNFKITVADGNGILVFSSVGYASQQVNINNRSTINIVLSADTKSLDEVVVVGYGTQKKANVTGSMANFNAKDLDQRPVARVDQALIGQLAGVSVKQTSGVPGKGFSVQVRGSGSISASNEPLYVIDGFPLETSGQNASGGFSTGNPLDNLNPNDIENIQVLKDASSAAIYGSRAANGVVLITTKKGQDGKAKISLNVYSGITKATRMLDMLNADEWIDRSTEMINAQWVASGTGRTASQTTAERRTILKLADGTFNTSLMLDDRWAQAGRPGLTSIDWQKEAFRTGVVKNYQLSASGGNANVKYYVSGNLLNQDGTVLNTYYKNYSARANVEVKANEHLKFGVNLAPSYSEANDPGVEGKDAIIHLVASIAPVQEANAGLNANTGAFPNYLWSGSRNSPVRQLENNVGLTKTFRTLFSTYVDYELMKGLNFRSSINFDNTDLSTKRYSPDWVNGSQSARLTTPGTSTSGSFATLKKQTLVNENTLSYNTTIAKDHDVSAVVGYAYNLTKLATSTMSSAGGFNSSTITTLNAAASVTGNTSETQNVLLSYFGRVQYGYKGKYLLSASVRRDGSSRFGDNNKWGLFPSASVGWRLSEENFMKAQSAVSELKLRASWGQAGNYNIGDYSGIATLGFANYTFGGVQVGGQTPNRISNPDLTWEKSQTIDVGVDVGFLKNRFTAAFDYYTKKILTYY